MGDEPFSMHDEINFKRAKWMEKRFTPFCVALDTKLREFQYKLLLNRCLDTNIILYKINVVPSQEIFSAEVIKCIWIDELDIKIEQRSDII